MTNVTGITGAKVTIPVEGLETKTLNVSNITINGQVGEVKTESVAVTLRGEPEVRHQADANNVRIAEDTTYLGTAVGDFKIPAKVVVDGFTGVGAIEDYTIFYKKVEKRM